MLESPSSHTWSPQPQLVAVGWLLAALAGIWVACTNDTPGRILVGCAGLALFLAALYGTVIRPRLTANTSGITLRGLRTRSWAWHDVHYKVTKVTRFGRTVTTLEFTVTPDEHIIFLGRLELGASLDRVAQELRRIQSK